GGAYVDRRAAMGMPKGVFFDAFLTDMNGDGFRDLVGLGKTSVSVYPGSATTFGSAIFTRSVSAPRQVEVADLDQDGDPDIYVTTGVVSGTNQPDLLLENDGTGK